MATSNDIRAFQSATNAWTRHHTKDLLAPLKVDGTFGPNPGTSLTHKVPLRAFWYFGGGLPTIRQWDKHVTDEAISHLTRWFRHPGEFYKTHPAAWAIGKKRIATERAKRIVHHVIPTSGLVWFDGARISAWIAKELQRARDHGWNGTIPDKVYGGYRSYAMQAALYRDYQNGGGIAAAPGTSRHEFINWDGGAADCSDYYTLSDVLGRIGSDLRWAGDVDPVHFSSRHYHERTGGF